MSGWLTLSEGRDGAGGGVMLAAPGSPAIDDTTSRDAVAPAGVDCSDESDGKVGSEGSWAQVQVGVRNRIASRARKTVAKLYQFNPSILIYPFRKMRRSCRAVILVYNLGIRNRVKDV